MLMALYVFPATALVVYAAIRLAKELDPFANIPTRICQIIVLVWAVIAACAFMLGSAHWLTGGRLILTVTVVCCITVGAIHRFRTTGGKYYSQPLDQLAWQLTTGWGVVWTVAAAIGGAHMALNGLAKLPTDFDSLAYHLPTIDEWIKDHSLYAPRCAHWSNPSNYALLCYWCVASFSGDYLSPMASIVIAVLLACGLFCLS